MNWVPAHFVEVEIVCAGTFLDWVPAYFFRGEDALAYYYSLGSTIVYWVDKWAGCRRKVFKGGIALRV